MKNKIAQVSVTSLCCVLLLNVESEIIFQISVEFYSATVHFSSYKSVAGKICSSI